MKIDNLQEKSVKRHVMILKGRIYGVITHNYHTICDFYYYSEYVGLFVKT